jgi:hypothetical protein
LTVPPTASAWIKGDAKLTDDRLIQLLLYLTILLFVSAGVLPLARSRYPWAKWAKWGSIAIFSIAVVYAVALILRWGMGGG